MYDLDFCDMFDTFKTQVLPQTIDTGNIHKGIIAGKLNGIIPPVTPNGVL